MRLTALLGVLLPAALLPAAALAVPKGYTDLNRDQDGCSFYAGPTLPSGFAVQRAECEWDNVSAERLDALLSELALHAELFPLVERATPQGPAEDGTLVRQHHRVSGLGERQVDLIFTRAQQEQAVVHSFRMATTQPGAEGLVPAACAGRWELSPRPSGGVRVVHELHYEPGGKVPPVVQRALQATGIVEQVTALHEHAITRR